MDKNNGNTHTQNKWKKVGNWISQQHTAAHSAALSSAQQCSLCNQFQGFLTFSRVRDEKGENEAKKMQNPFKQFGKKNKFWTKQWENTHKTMEKGWELDFPAALSSTQQCSICNQFQGFLTFCRVRVEKVRTKPKK